MTQIKINSPRKNIAKLLKGKKVLFLENDNGLYNGLNEFEQVLKDNKIEYKCLFDLSEQPFDTVIDAIKEYDAIVFQTQWVYDVSKKLKEYMFASTDKKIVIECVIDEPTWYYKPKSAHDVYFVKCPMYDFEAEAGDEFWEFKKLSNKPYWDYKNKFDK